MTTEGDGNYKLQQFLEQEGAEVDIQTLVTWLLFMVWENTVRHRAAHRPQGGRRRLHGPQGQDAPDQEAGDPVGAEKVIRGRVPDLRQRRRPATATTCPTWTRSPKCQAPHYDNNNRGGEAHMEVGKLIHFVEDKVNHMTISVKPFGCIYHHRAYLTVSRASSRRSGPRPSSCRSRPPVMGR